MRRKLPAAVITLIVVLGGCGVSHPSGAPLPSAGGPEVAVSYRLTLFCPAPVSVGDSVWLFTQGEPWPPDEPHWWPWDSIRSPYAVPGLLTLSSEQEAVFRADIDGSQLRLTRGDEADLGDACL